MATNNYQGVDDLRAALTDDEDEVRLQAYDDVSDTSLEPAQVINGDVTEGHLVEEGLVPEPEPDPSAREHREQQIELLKQIKAAVTEDE